MESLGQKPVPFLIISGNSLLFSTADAPVCIPTSSALGFPYDLTYKRNLMNKNKLTSKIELEAWKHGTDWQRPEGRGEGDNGGKKGKGLIREHV